MKKAIKYIGIGILVVIVVFVGSCVNLYHQEYKQSHRSFYVYEVGIDSEIYSDADATLCHNGTLYVPLPVFNGESNIGDAIIVGGGERLPWYEPATPYDWIPSIVETEYGKMLKITAEKINPYPPTNMMVIAVPADHVINTKRPIGNEPLLSPMHNLTKLTTYEFQSPPPWAPHCYRYDDCYKYESRIYVDYTTSPDVNVSISIRQQGVNEWFELIGWTGNHYDEAIGITLTGDQHGWQVTSGMLAQGGGRYSWLCRLWEL